MAREPDNWFRKLQGDRLEISLRAMGVKVRASGDEAAMYALVQWFEERTQTQVVGPTWRRPLRTGPRPLEGQVTFSELASFTFSELSSDDTVGADA